MQCLGGRWRGNSPERLLIYIASCLLLGVHPRFHPSSHALTDSQMTAKHAPTPSSFFLQGRDHLRSPSSLSKTDFLSCAHSSFSFLMPYEWENNLPKPNTNEIFFSNVSEQCVGILKFGGFVKNNRAQKKVNELRDKLSALNLNYSNDFIIAVYQPPYQLINRKNEIVLGFDSNQ